MIGVDLVNISEFAKQLSAGGEPFLGRTFLASELNNRNTEHLAGLFAAKEAAMKALKLPVSSWLSIEILTRENRPVAVYQNEEIEISIAHHIDYAVAVAFKNG